MTILKKWRYLTIALGIILILGTGSQQTFAQTKAPVRAGVHPTFGRLVFDLGENQKYDAQIKDGFLTIHFEKPFDADLAKVSRVLDKYLGKGFFIDGKKGIRFPVKGNISLKSNRYDTAVVLDLSTNKSSSQSPSIKVRSGDHAKFSRLVLDWPSKTGFTISEGEKSITLDFDKPGELQLSNLQRDLPKFVKSLKSQISKGKTTFTIETEHPISVKAFRSGNSIVFDLRQALDKPAAPSNKTVAKVEKPKKPTVPVKKVSKPQNLAPILNKSEGAIQEAAVDENQDEQQETPLAEQITPKPLSLLPINEGAQVTTVSSPIEIVGEKLVVGTGKLKDGFRLIFPWKKSTGMAFFERGGVYWLVFDEQSTLDFSKINGPYKFLVVRKKQIPHAKATIARLTVREGYAPSVTRAGNEWQVDFRIGEAPVIKNIVDIQSQPSSTEGARIFIPAVNNGDKVSFIDPQVGDELVAIPLYAPSWGIGSQRTFAQFTILPSVQGIALTPRETDVKIAVERNGVSITAKGGLQLSRTISKEDLFAGGDQTDRFTRRQDKAQLVKMNEWAQVSAKDFIERKQLLQRKVARAPRAGRNAMRMELAKFFVAHKYHADAFGVLERIRIDDPRADEDVVYRLLRGLASLGLNHIEEAEKDLFHPAFSGFAEVAPWRAQVAAKKEDWKLASREIEIGKEAFGVYSDDFQNRFKLLRARTALEDYDIELAIKSLESIRSSLGAGQDPAVAAEREYLEGVAALRSGDVEKALSKFEQAIALDYRPVSARAQFAKINAELAQKLISTEDAIESFKKMEFAWRGDDLELEILKRIGDLHIATGQMRDGLNTFRNIIKTFPKTPLARDIAREMTDIFNQLYLEGEAEKLPPIKALALYYEYRELTPLGKKGDQMIRKLADRLIKVDLLDQAAQLLDHQINFRLKGELKALTGTKLAVVHLWNEKPQESLNILQKSRWRALPDSVKQERLHIQARAYSELKDYEEALGLLEEDNSEKGDLLRAEIHWKAKNWSKVISSLEKLLNKSGAAKSKKLKSVDRQRLMQLAVARSLSNDRAGIAVMRRTYRKKMVDTPDLDAFDLITDTLDGSDTEFRKRSTAIAKIGQLESFMAGYREQLKNGDFWATN